MTRIQSILAAASLLYGGNIRSFFQPWNSDNGRMAFYSISGKRHNKRRSR